MKLILYIILIFSVFIIRDLFVSNVTSLYVQRGLNRTIDASSIYINFIALIVQKNKKVLLLSD